MSIPHVDEVLQLLEHSEGGWFSFLARGAAMILRLLLGRPKPKTALEKLQEADLEERQRQRDDAILISQIDKLFDEGKQHSSIADTKIAELLDVRLEVAQRVLRLMMEEDKLGKVIQEGRNWYHRALPSPRLRNRG